MIETVFTLIELLMATSMIGVLSSIVIFALNPRRQFGQAADSQRTASARQIEKAMLQYLIDEGELPSDRTIASGSGNAVPICRNSYTDGTCINIDQLFSRIFSLYAS